jgi:primosomal replication protein N
MGIRTVQPSTARQKECRAMPVQGRQKDERRFQNTQGLCLRIENLITCRNNHEGTKDTNIKGHKYNVAILAGL